MRGCVFHLKLFLLSSLFGLDAQEGHLGHALLFDKRVGKFDWHRVSWRTNVCRASTWYQVTGRGSFCGPATTKWRNEVWGLSEASRQSFETLVKDSVCLVRALSISAFKHIGSLCSVEVLLNSLSESLGSFLKGLEFSLACTVTGEKFA